MAMASLLKVLLAAASLAHPSVAEDAADFGFGSDVAEKFVMPPSPEHVNDIAADAGKPVMAILMNKVSPVCKTLKKAIKNGSKVKALLDSFIVTYAEDNIDKWSTDKYVPQVVFYNNGEKMDVESGHKSGKYLYADETKLEAAMQKALSQAKGKKEAASGGSGKARCIGGPDCKSMDEQDMCEFTDGCTWAKPQKAPKSDVRGCSGAPECSEYEDKDSCEFSEECSWSSGAGSGSGPCKGGNECHGVEDKELCEFTDGCTWEGEEDDFDTFEDEDGVADSHAFSKDIAAKLMVDEKPVAVRAAAKKKNKPYMVLLTQAGCAPCEALIQGINSGGRVKPLLDKFVVAHSSGNAINEWQPKGEHYVPQAHFFSAKGKLLPVKGPNDKFKHFFDSEGQLLAGINQALKMVAKDEL